MNPFSSFEIYPHYGKGRVVVCWALKEEFVDGQVYLYRSDEGVSYELVSENPVGPDVYVDTWKPGSIDTQVTYRACVELNDEEHDGPVVGLTLNQPRMVIEAAMIAQREKLLHLTLPGTLRLWLCRPLTSGTPCPSNQQIGECPDAANGCYGQKFVGGFSDPWPTHGAILQRHVYERQQSPDGAGIITTRQLSMDLVPFPPARPDDMLVDADTNERWAIGRVDPVRVGPFLIGQTAVITKLDYNDQRQAFPVPVPDARFQLPAG